MGVGQATSNVTIDANLTRLAVELRNVLTEARRLDTQVNGQGAGLAFLENAGYSAAANANNPGGQSDAAWALQAIAYLNTIAGVYLGEVRQGGDGTAGSAVTFAFDNALSLLWGGQLG